MIDETTRFWIQTSSGNKYESTIRDLLCTIAAVYKEPVRTFVGFLTEDDKKNIEQNKIDRLIEQKKILENQIDLLKKNL